MAPAAPAPPARPAPARGGPPGSAPTAPTFLPSPGCRTGTCCTSWERASVTSMHAAGSPSLSILVVDDESSLRDTLTHSFTREGHRVQSVADGTAAIELAEVEHFDVILLDVALGAGPNGYDVCRTLRARRNVVPIIMLTALDSEADAVQGLSLIH